MYLVEDFYSFQGEGKYVGNPSIFFRFGGCNLECKGFNCRANDDFENSSLLGCDSIFAVNREEFQNSWLKINSIEQLLTILNRYQKSLKFKPDIVLTGGEPLINYRDKIFYKFLTHLIEKKYKVTIETNATIDINFEKNDIYKKIIFAMGVKLANSNEKLEKRINIKAIEKIVLNSNDNFFKFVVDNNYLKEYGNREIEEIIKNFKKSKVYIMPIGDSVETISKNDENTIEFCKKYGYIYCDRVHIRVYNKRIGV